MGFDFFGAIGNGLNALGTGISEGFANVVTGGGYGRTKTALQSWDPHRDAELGNAPNAQKAAESLTRSGSMSNMVGPGRGHELVDPFSTSGKFVYPGTPEYDKAMTYYNNLSQYGSANAGGTKQAAPVQLGGPARMNTAAPASSSSSSLAPAQGNVHGMSGLYGNTGQDKAVQVPDNSAMSAASAASYMRPTGPSSYEQQVNDAIKAFRDKYTGIETSLKGLGNPFDTQGDMFKNALSAAMNRTTRDWSGAEEHNASQMAQMGMSASGQAAGNTALIEAHRRQALSDTENGMYSQALANGGQFEMQRQQALAGLAQGDLATSGGLLTQLDGMNRDDNRFNLNMAFQKDRAAASDKQWQAGYDQTERFHADANAQAQQQVDLQKQAMTYAQQMGKDQNEAEVWANGIASMPGILKWMSDNGVTMDKLWKMFHPQDGQSAQGGGPGGSYVGSGPGPWSGGSYGSNPVQVPGMQLGATMNF